MKASDALSAIKTFLASLPHVGRDGFEGLVASLLEAATGQRFRLSGSGQQLGQDARSEPGYGNNIKVEAKHYAKSTLDLRELSAEILQATAADPSLELWVLAASCAITDQHASELEALGRQLEVEVLLLDLGNDDLPRLAILMAAFPEKVSDWVSEFSPDKPAISLPSALTELAAQCGFAAATEQVLSKLRGTLLGYEDARQRSRQCFLRSVSNVGNARAAFCQPAAVRASDVHLIPRTSVTDRLVAWWTKSDGTFPRAVVLGEEGMGKTWAVLAWLAERAQADALPIILPFSATAETLLPSDTITSLLPKLLRKWTAGGTVQLWETRLRKWFAGAASSRPLILVMADGLNERPNFNWPSFFHTAEDEHWRNRLAILVTDRPGHWEPACARAGLYSFTNIPISGYTNAELDQALEGKGISLSQIPSALQELIRTPRYCELVTTHFEEMKTEGDFTVERLILLDARSRTEKKLGSLTEQAFMEIIRNLALQYRQAPVFTLSTIQLLLPQPDPDRQIYQEIIDGGLLIRQPGILPKFVIERTRLVFGLGMLLADEIATIAESGKDRSHVEDEIARWFEPHPEMDLKVEICGAALFHSLIPGAYPVVARRELFRYWLRLRNRGDTAQAAFIDYVLRCPEDFVAAVEDVWSSDRELGAAQEFLSKAFIKHRDDDRVYPVLQPAIARWMGFVHPAGAPFLRRQGKDKEDREQEVEKRVGAILQPGPVEICGQSLTVVENDGLLRLKRLAFLIISSGSRESFIHSFIPWTVASAIMGYDTESDVAAWVVRLSDENLQDLLIPEAERLLRRPELIARTAGRRLVQLFDPLRADAVFETYPDEYYANWKRE